MIKKYLNFIKFFFSSSLVLLIKITFFSILEFRFNAEISYFLTHIIIVFISYFLHCKFTFKSNYSFESLIKFITSVFLFKFFDYLIFIILFNSLSIDSILLILIVSIIIFIFRFLLIKNIFFKQNIGKS